MKERPILFRPEMVRAILEGRKTQTRRPIKPQPTLNEHGYFQWTPSSEGHNGIYTPDSLVSQCPYGEPGDRAEPGDCLWVREPFYIDHFSYVRGPLPKERPDLDDGMLIYRADGTCCEQFGECSCAGKGAPWRPSIHMPRWACRLVLEIVNVRVERLKGITPADALAEGVFCPEACYAQNGERAPVLLFGALWESIHGPGSWDANPWLWVLEFKKV